MDPVHNHLVGHDLRLVEDMVTEGGVVVTEEEVVRGVPGKKTTKEEEEGTLQGEIIQMLILVSEVLA